jgi:signal transduction histidine kinase
MVQTILDVSKMEEGKLKLNLSSIEVPQLVGSTIDRMYLDAFQHCPVERSFAEKGPSVLCDPDLIQRVVMNLLDNALKYTPLKGKVAIRIEPQLNDVRVEIADTGPGIPSEFHEMIFQKYGFLNVPTHTFRQSTGLGLAFCKMAVEAHKGKIGFESRVGEGSTFWFALPQAASA